MKKIIRFPRTAGTTLELIEIRIKERNEDTSSQKQRKKLINNIINHYINNQFKLNNKQLSFQELSTYLNVPVQYVINKSLKGEIKYMSGNGAGMIDRIQDTSRMMIGNLIFNLTKDRYLIEQQTDMLIKKQRNRYVPFLTSEVNKSIKTQLDSNSLYTDLIKTLIQSTQSNIQILNQQKNYFGPEKDNQLSVLQAIELLDERALPHGSDLAATAIEALYINDGLPNIIAKEKRDSNRVKALPFKTLQNEIDNSLEAEVIEDEKS